MIHQNIAPLSTFDARSWQFLPSSEPPRVRQFVPKNADF